jgi:CRP/FNR family transcriptional regulator
MNQAPGAGGFRAVRSPDDSPRSSCFTCPAFSRSEWEALDDAEVAVLDQAKVARRYAAGEFVFAEGEAAAGIHCIGAGLVCLRRRDVSGRNIPLAMQYPGDTLGAPQFLSGAPHRATAEVSENARICFVGADTVRALLSRSVCLALALVRRLTVQLDEAESRLLRRKFVSVRGRVAQLLVDLSGAHAVHDRNGGFVLTLPLSLADLGLAIGLSPPVMSRTMQALERDGILSTRGRTLAVPDRDRLMAMLR